MTEPTNPDLPRPARPRWQPLRAGLVDIFYYDDEEFRFHDGRLLLRGNNGTGKSKVLALTLPFLLDGELAANRVEPDGDRAKRMEWNLLLGGKHPNDERTGYTWLEFGRLDEDGQAHYRTIGCGLKAVKGKGIARHWFFVTDRRVGEDLALVSATRVPATRDRLKDALGDRGLVYETATEYRRAVDEALFGLGRERYEALVGLLIQLRQPQLSKKPDEKLLSRALTEALPPLDPALIGEVAEAFRGLDEEREALLALQETARAAELFLGHYRRYARVAAKRQAAVLRLAHSKYEHLGRDLGEEDAAYTDAAGRLASALDRLGELESERERLSAARDALNRSPEMDAARGLQEAGKAARTLADLAADRAAARDQARHQAENWARRVAAAQARSDNDASALDDARTRASRTAERAGIDHAAVWSETEREAAPYPQARRAGERAVEQRTGAIAGLESLLAALDRAHERAKAARAEASRAAEDRTAGQDRVSAAQARITELAAELVEAYRGWFHAHPGTCPEDPDAVLANLESWAETLDGANPAAEAARAAHQRTSGALTRREAGLEAQRTDARARLADAAAEIERLEAGGHQAPTPAHTRDAPARADRPGAAFWRAVDFAEHVSEADRAGLEAALEAAGILDAWLSPDGVLHAAGSGDALVLPTATPAPDGGLTALLRPAVDRADPQAAELPDHVVTAVLASIGARESDHAAWADTNGHYRLGVLRGRWSKESACFIGDGAREAARRARLAELAAHSAQIQAELDRIALGLDEVHRLAEALAEHLRVQPSDAALRDAHSRLSAQNDLLRALIERAQQAQRVAVDRQQAVEDAENEADQYAQDTALPSDREALTGIRDAVNDYRTALAALWPAAKAAVEATAALGDAQAEANAAAETLTAAAEQAERAEREAAGAEERRRVLQETIGASVEELFRRLHEVEAAQQEREQTERATRAEHDSAMRDRERADGRRDLIRREIEAATQERDTAVLALREFARTGLLATALPGSEHPPLDAEWAPSPAVALARAINQDLDAVDDADRAWDLIQQRVAHEIKALTDALGRHGHSVGMTPHAGLMLVDVVYLGRSQDVPALAAALAEDAEQRGRLLSAKERELLENHLVGEVAGALQELIAAAEEHVLEMNTDLEQRPTSTGMLLRFQWNPAKTAPEGLEAVRGRLLRKSADVWTPADRALVGQFLQARIAADREERPGDSWADQLARALDYRAWHEFAIQRRQDGQWRPATGPASGGERVLAASIPLFAAASSHYSSGRPTAPRLIALDEAFAGVDDDSRAKCLGLLASFDLDVVMTSEREWACYPTVPGVAIAQLSRREGVDAVLVTPWVWDGRERRRAPRSTSFASGAPEQPDADNTQEALFA
ncbi:TIGR02680 family protein [Actinospica sp. MGRD01-02]|uniref:TIGR02680 family protein n=1 Tax=Actinospica acidithermotolerans TaxID=2828514 RepID=A0A941IIF8_9ACTN|nr:TIGR02680 family protein [Actinospica acidithermotolerans]MBR7824711.1 TIGR02680 family protein [Actinospica acidithermotolerans]